MNWEKLNRYISTGYESEMRRKFLDKYSQKSIYHKSVVESFKNIPDESLLIYDDIYAEFDSIRQTRIERLNKGLVEVYKRSNDKKAFWIEFTNRDIYNHELFDGTLFEVIHRCSRCGISEHGIIMDYQLTNGLCPECQNHIS